MSNNGEVDQNDAKKKITENLKSVKEEDRINYLINRLVDLDVESSRTKKEATVLKKDAEKSVLLQKKLNSAEKILSKTEIAKSKLEELCRELQKSKKEDSERYCQHLKKVELTHQEALENLKGSIGDVQKSVDASGRITIADFQSLENGLSDLSAEYETRLSELKRLYEERQKSLSSMISVKDEELKHMRTEMDKMRDKIKEVFGENVALKKELVDRERHVKHIIESELATRQKFEEYTNKYTDLLSNLTTSNEAFDRAKNEMSKMNGQLIKLQGDAFRYKKQLEESNLTVLSLTTVKLDLENALAVKDRQLGQLQNLCRRLQKGEDTAETPEAASSADQ